MTIDSSKTGDMAMSKLPQGHIRPDGFWKSVAENVADSWLKRVIDTDHEDFLAPPWNRNSYVGWRKDGQGEGSGYVGDAIVRLAHMLPDSYIAQSGKDWVKKVLEAQDPDGYLGCARPENRFKGYFDLWPTCLQMYALVAEYEAHRDPQVLRALEMACEWVVRNMGKVILKEIFSTPKTFDRPWQSQHAINLICPMYWVYQYTGREEFRQAAVELFKDYDKAIGNRSSTTILTSGAAGSREHIVGISMHITVLATAYLLTGEYRYLEASEHLHKCLSTVNMNASGIMAGNEVVHRNGPTKWTEHCGVVEWVISNSFMVAVTGNPKYADFGERCMWNAYFGSRTKDGVCLAYNHAPNQIVAADYTGAYEDNADQSWNRAYYSAQQVYTCCNANTSRCFPGFVEHAVLTGQDDSVSVVYYGDFSVEDAGGLGFEMRSNYPFEDEATLHITRAPEGRAKLRLRVPGWCDSAEISVNGKDPGVETNPGMFATLWQNFTVGDEIRIRFSIPFEVDCYDGSWTSVPSFAVRRGPLTFVLPVETERIGIKGYTSPPAPPELDVHYNFEPAPGAIWNYALDLDLKNLEQSLRLVRRKDTPSGHPFEHAPVSVEVKARRVQGWGPDQFKGHDVTPTMPEPPLQLADKSEILRLVPFGSTEIRMTYLPVVGIEKVRTDPDGSLEVV